MNKDNNIKYYIIKKLIKMIISNISSRKRKNILFSNNVTIKQILMYTYVMSQSYKLFG